MRKEGLNGMGSGVSCDQEYRKIGKLTRFYPKGKEPEGLYAYRHVNDGRMGMGLHAMPLIKESLTRSFRKHNSGDLGAGTSEKSLWKARRRLRNS